MYGNLVPNSYDVKCAKKTYYHYIFDDSARDSLRIQLHSYHFQRILELHQLERSPYAAYNRV
jgi:hypothetical protein